MNNVLITIGVLIVVVLGALFAVPQFVDWNAYRGVVEEETSRIAGRDVRIGGDIKLRLLPSPSFVINKLRIADQATGSGEPMFRADQVAARLSVVPLLRGVLEANEIELVRPVLRFIVDESGRSNWRGIGKASGSLPFVPNDVALQSVRVTDGTLQVLDRQGTRERAVMPQLNGQLSAPALEGPYRFRGTFGSEAGLREVRLSTGTPEASGAVPVKASLRDPANGATATVDGRLSNLAAELGFAGELTASWALPGASKVAKPGAAGPPLAELKSEIIGDVRSIALKNLSVAFESAGRPEVLAGSATFVWGDEVATAVRLTAPWLDLDPVLGTQKGVSPLFALADFAQRINGLMGEGGGVEATLQIDQANLGYDLVGGIRIAARSQSGALVLEELRASLPGGARLEIQGRITGHDAATSFDGDLTLQTNSAARLGAWLNGGTAVIAPQHDSAARMRARLVSEAERISLTNIEGDVGDGPLTGRLDYTWSGTPRVVIAVEGVRLDARAVLPEKLSLQGLARGMATTNPPANGVPAPTGSAPATELSVRMRAAEVRLPDRSMRNVVAALTRTAAGLAVEQLQFTSGNGTSVMLEGRRGADAAMDFKGALSAATPDGLASLAEFFDIPAGRLPASLVPDLLPLRVAGTFVQGSGDRATLRLTADGQLGKTDAKLRLTFDAGLKEWRTAPLEADVVLLGPRDAQVLERALAVVRGLPRPAASASGLPLIESETTRQSRLSLRASGRAADGMLTAVRFDSPDSTLAFSGRARLSDTAAADVQGDVGLQARDAREFVSAWTRLEAGSWPTLAGAATARLALRGSDLVLDGISATATSGATVKGQLTSSITAGTQQTRLRGKLEISSLEALHLLAPVLQVTPQSVAVAMAGAAQAVDAGSGLWPLRPFDLAAAATADVEVAVRAGELVLPAGGAVTEAQFTYALRREGAEVRDFQARAMGGSVTGTMKLAPSQKGGSFTARLSGKSLRLDGYGPTGAADVELDVGGDGNTPAVLVGGLAGQSNLTIAAAQVRELSPASLQGAIDAALKAPPDKVSVALRGALAADTARVLVPLGPRKIAMKVQDGVVASAPITLPLPPGKVIAQAGLELATLSLNGSWRVETAIPPFATGAPAAAEPTTPIPLPPVVQRFQIKPQDIGVPRKTPRPAIEVDGLERELAVRKVERDLAELERLRRLDEERIAAAAAAAAREKEVAAEAAARAAEQKPAAPQQ